MKIGVRAHDYGRMEPGKLARLIKAGGYETVQLAPTKAISGIETFQDITPEHLLNIENAFRLNQLEMSVYGCYIEPSLTDREKRLENVEIFKRGIGNAKYLGIPLVGTETTHFPVSGQEEDREKIYQLLKDSVLRMAEKAEKENVYIGIEPVAEHTLNTPQMAKRLLDDVKSDKLKIIFDPSNLLLPDSIESQDSIFKEVFRLLGNHMEALHVKDIIIENGVKKMVPIGQGVVKFPNIFQWVRRNRPELVFLRENAKMETNETDIETMKKYWHNN